MNAPPDVLNLFVEPTGALLYFLAVFVMSQAALVVALGQRMRGPQERTAGRYVTTSLGVILCWGALVVGGLVVLLTRAPSNAILPPLDRAAGALIILIAGWGFSTADSPVGERQFNILYSILAAGIVVGFVYTEIRWYGQPSGGFNLNSLGLAWTVIPLTAAIFAFATIIARWRMVIDAPLKLVYLILLMAGYVYTLYSIANKTLGGDDSGAIRLAFLAATPVLPFVIYRWVVLRLTRIAEENADKLRLVPLSSPTEVTAVSQIDSESLSVLKALGDMIEREKPDDIPIQIAVATANALKADVVALLSIDDAEYADVIAAYDNIQQIPIAAMALKIDEQPTLVQAMQERTQKALDPDRHLNELVDLYTRLDIQRIGPAYFQPLTREGVALAALVIALPYTQRTLRSNEMNLLTALAPIAARLLGISRAALRMRNEAGAETIRTVVDGAPGEVNSQARAEMLASLETARSQIGELSDRVKQLQIELDYERSRLAQLSGDDAEGQSITQRLEALSGERAKLAEERERMAQALQEAQTRIVSMTARSDDDVYATMIDVLQKERDDLQAQKAQLEAQLSDIRKRSPNMPPPAALRRLLTSLSEDKARLQVERDQMAGQLTEVQSQLKALGIEGPSGLAQMLAQLTEERTHYKIVAERAMHDREVLLEERQKLSDQIAAEAQREDKMIKMQDALRRLALDREALARQRDGLRQSLTNQGAEVEKFKAERARFIAEAEALQEEIKAEVFERNRVQAELVRVSEERAGLEKDRDRLAAERTTLKTERDQMDAASEGNREMLQKLVGSPGTELEFAL